MCVVVYLYILIFFVFIITVTKNKILNKRYFLRVKFFKSCKGITKFYFFFSNFFSGILSYIKSLILLEIGKKDVLLNNLIDKGHTDNYKRKSNRKADH